jgi:hypothetical protein
MQSSKLLLAGGLVCLLTLSGAAVPQAEAQGRRARSRGGVVTPQGYRAGRPVVRGRAPVGQRGPTARSFSRGRVVRGFPSVGYRSYGYAYRPRFSVGLYAGPGYWPSPYAYGYPSYYPYGYSYGYGYRSPYAYAPRYDIAVGGTEGGVRLDVAPDQAAVTVDGYYVGVVDDFDEPGQRLPLDAGPHRIEIQSPGYETLSFEVNVRPGQTVWYRGDMPPQQP